MKSGNAHLRTQAGVYCNVRPYGPITVVRSMPCLPYSQNKPKFSVDDSGVIHSGLYYKPGSFKAQNCVKGRKRLIEFAQANNVDFDICGKIVVAVNKFRGL